MQATVVNADCASPATEHLALTRAKPDICSELKRRYSIFKQNLGKVAASFPVMLHVSVTDTRHVCQAPSAEQFMPSLCPELLQP